MNISTNITRLILQRFTLKQVKKEVLQIAAPLFDIVIFFLGLFFRYKLILEEGNQEGDDEQHAQSPAEEINGGEN